MNPKIKISQLPAKGANLAAEDLLEVAEFTGTGYVSKSITGQEIIDAATGSGVTAVTGTAPIESTGGTTPDISIRQSGSLDDGYLSSADWIAFNNKQDALVSGTNIKTVNSTSLLGSGNVSVGVTSINTFSPLASTGGATPTLSISEAGTSGDGYLNSTDWNTFNNKQAALVSGTNIKTINSTSVLGSGNIAVQPTLVSGTNIKTINGSSVLGSGDLVVSGGGGIGGVQAFFPVSGNVIPAAPYGGLFGSAMIADRVLIYPFVPSQNFTTSALRINVTAAVAGANARILIYNNASGTYRPNSKILETTNLDCSTTGEKSFLYSATFTKGQVYWVAVYSNSTPSVTHISAGNLFTLRQEQGNAMQEIEATYTFGTAPTTFPTIIGYNNRNCPNVSFVIA